MNKDVLTPGGIVGSFEENEAFKTSPIDVGFILTAGKSRERENVSTH